MLLATIRRRFTFAVMSVLFLMMLLPLNILSSTAFAQTKAVQCPQGQLCSFTIASHIAIAQTGSGLTVQKVWTRDGNGKDKSIFKPGDAIQYALYVNNSSGSTITATFHFESYWGTINDGTLQTIDHIFSGVQVPTGVTGFYTPTTVPSDALPGSYTDRVYVWDENNNNNQDTGYGSFIVTGSKRLAVPYYTQYKGQPAQNHDCGPASVAMVLSYYSRGPGGTKQGLIDIRNATGNTSGGDTGSSDLENALSHYGSSYSEIPNNIQGLPSPDVQISDMAAAIKQGYPIIGFINAFDFGRSYNGHWLVVTGFSSDGTNNYVLLNDPDNQNPRHGYPNWIKGGKISVLLSTFQKAEYDAQAGPYGIIVTS